MRIAASLEQPTAIRAILAHFVKHGALKKAQQQCCCERAAHLECIGGSFDGDNDLCTRPAAFAHSSTAVEPEFALVRPLALSCGIYSI